MTPLNLSDLNKGEGYPVVTTEFGFERLQELLQQRVQEQLRTRIGLVRKYGIKTVEDAAALLERMAGNLFVHGWIIVINPRNGRDEQTVALLKQACSAVYLTPKAATDLALRTPLCVLHVEQPEGSPNSWTGGLSGGVVALMSSIPRAAWGRFSVFFCSGETIISPFEMEKFRTDTPFPVLTCRHSPEWLHPGLIEYGMSYTFKMQTIQNTLSVLGAAIKAGDTNFLTHLEIARLVPLWRNTGRCWLLSDIAKIGLFDRRCNIGQGMEDWFHILLWMHGLSTPAEQQAFDDLTRNPVVLYNDERILAADTNESLRPDQISKFRNEIAAWKERFAMFIASGRPTKVPEPEEEFKIPQ